MTKNARIPAALVYLLPIIGWLYVGFFHRKNDLAIFHLRQSIGLCLFLVGVLIAWAVVATLIAFIPYMAVLSIALFTLVIAAYMVGFVVWLMGITHALNHRLIPLPFFGQYASRLPIGSSS
jgi:uncharacterized membrane protein